MDSSQVEKFAFEVIEAALRNVELSTEHRAGVVVGVQDLKAKVIAALEAEVVPPAEPLEPDPEPSAPPSQPPAEPGEPDGGELE